LRLPRDGFSVIETWGRDSMHDGPGVRHPNRPHNFAGDHR
jgi:hypothetical protein